MQIVDVISALVASDEELWQFLGDYWGLNTYNGFIKCYGLFTESKKADLVGCVSHITLRGKPITLPFNEAFNDVYGIWNNPKSIRFGYVSFNMRLVRIDKRRELGHPFVFTVDPYSLHNVYPEMDMASKEAELKRVWGASNNIASGICIKRRGYYYLEDIRNEYDVELSYPDTKERVAPLPVSIRNPKINTRYFFIWELAPRIICSEFTIAVNKSKQILEEEKVRLEGDTGGNVGVDVSLYSKILKNWKTDNRLFVGCYDYDKEKKYYCFTDIRSASFHELKYPNLERKSNVEEEDIVIPLDKPIDGLELKSYYKIWWNIVAKNNDRGYAFVFDDSLPTEPIDPSGLIKLLKSIWDVSDISVSGTMDDAMEMVSAELMSSSNGTFIYELLQNANDYPIEINDGKDVEKVDVEFHITDNYLVFRHSGDFFSAKDIAAICKLGSGTKKRKKNAIGYKGIGFKTVFNGSDYVYVKTGKYSFRFDRKGVKSEYDPWQIMPILTSERSLPEEVSRIITDDQTHFRVQMAIHPENKAILRLLTAQDKEKSFEYLFKDIFKDVRDIIFIPNVRSVRVFIDGEEVINRQKDESSGWLLSKAYIKPIEKEDQELINKETREHGKSRGIPKRYIDFNDTTILFACKVKDEKKLEPVEDATVNCYLPSQARFGFPFLMNTDMVPSGDRNQIKTNVEFNSIFAKMAGSAFAEWINDLLTKGYDACSVFDLIPDFETIKEGVGKQYKHFIECFESGFVDAIKTIPIIPVEGSEKLQVPSKILRDVTGFSSKGIISYKKFLQYTKNETLSLPLVSICNHSRLVRLLNESKECTKFRDSDLIALFANDSFKRDLLDVNINAKAIEFILDYTYKDNYKDLSIFINEITGALSKSSLLFFDIDEDRKLLKAFENQLSFLSVKTREILTTDSSETTDYIAKLKGFTWAQFKAYDSVIKPLFETLSCKEANLSLLKTESINIDMFSFLVKHQIKVEVVKSFPLLLSDGQWGKLSDICFFYCKDAVDSRSEQWLDKSWYSILSSKYVPEDPASSKTVKGYFNQLGVQDYSKKALYDRVIKNNSDHIDAINKKCSASFETFSGLIAFLYQIKDEKEIGTFNHFSLPVTSNSGTSLDKAGKDNTVFLYSIGDNETFSALLNKTWVQDGWAYIMDSRCQSILPSEKPADISKFFKDKFSVKEPNTNGFCRHVAVKNIDEIVASISPVYKAKEETPEIKAKIEAVRKNNLDFFQFVCENSAFVFAEGTNPFHNCGYPFCICNNDNVSTKPAKYYKYSTHAEDAATQEWLPEGLIGVIDKGYSEISESFLLENEIYAFLKVKEFNHSSFIKEDVSSNKAVVVAEMNTLEKNVAFHQYFKTNHSSFSKDDLEILKNFPVFTMGDTLPVKKMTSTGHRVVNPEAEKLIAAGYGTAGSMDMIPSDYFGDKDNDTEYWITILGNKEFSFKEICEWMTATASSTIMQKAQVLDDNLSFWRLVKNIPGASNKDNQKSLKTLRVFPIYNRCVKEKEATLSAIDLSRPCYVSDSYFVGDSGIEYMLNEYANSSFIVLGDYLEDSEEETILSWRKFWEAAGVLSSNEELIMNTIIPNLDRSENQGEKVPLLLFQNKDIIEKHLADEDNPEKVEKLKQDLNKLFIKTNGGMRLISEAFFLQQNEYAPFEEPMAYMPLLTQVIDYTPEQYAFFMKIGERAGSKKITDKQVWLIEKLKQFTLLQSINTEENNKSDISFHTNDIHFKFIEDLALWWDELNSMNYGSYFRKIKLYDKDGNLCSASELTEGSAYTPYCDFESCGIKAPLTYISDKYAGFKGILQLLNDMGIHHIFWKEDIGLLENKTFATYFWNKYLSDSSARGRINEFISEGVFKGKKCVPTFDGVKSAEELYNTFEVEGKVDLTPYVSLLKDGDRYRAHDIYDSFQDKNDPKVTYPNPIRYLGFITTLSKDHCFEYLLNSKVKHTEKRRYVLSLLYNYYNDNKITEADITTYRSSENANWLNGKKESAHISSLYAIGRNPDDRRFLRHFGNDSHIISNETISEKDDVFEIICDKILKIKVLHGGENSDFATRPSSDSVNETERIRELLIRKSLLLSTIINAPEGANWKEAYDAYVEKIKTLSFVKCSSISIECKLNSDISKSDVDAFHYDDGTSTFYYLKDWQDKFVFDSMWRQLQIVLEIPSEDDEMTIKRILDKDLSPLDVDDLISEYCTDFYNDEEFVSTLSLAYPDTAKRLSIKPVTDEEEEAPQKLVGLSTSRDDVTQKPVPSSTIPQTDSSPTQKPQTSVQSNTKTVEQEKTPEIQTAADKPNIPPHEEEPASSQPKETTRERDIQSNAPELKTSKEEASEGGHKNTDPSETRSSKPDTSHREQSESTPRARRTVSRRVPDDDEDWLDRYLPKTSAGASYDPTEWKKDVEQTELSVADLREDELEDIRGMVDSSMSEDKVVSEHYLVRYRLYNYLTSKGYEVGDKKAFITKQLNTISSNQGYIYARSARGGILFVSSFLWDKLSTKTGRLCMFYGNEADDFYIVDSIEKLVDFVGNDNIIVQVKGVNKLETMESVFKGELKEKAHILIRVRSNKRYNSLFTYDNDSDNMDF